MKFSICIPNYNYARYLPRTLASVLSQSHADLEVLVSDNASTDDSVAVVNAPGDPRVRVHVNRKNVGFSHNLDRAARLAVGDTMIMLSSDDLMRPGALADYGSLLGALGDDAARAVISSTFDVIDPDDAITGRTGPSSALWLPGDRDAALERVLGAPVYRVAAEVLLRRCLERVANPFNFASTAYPRALYEAIEGYGGGRMINPDKWFHWRLLAVAGTALFIDKPLFAYRWHPSNQTAQQQASGALKYLVDEYASTLELDGAILERLGMTRADLVRAFVKHDIARHGLATLARGQTAKAQRIFDFGTSVYPAEVRADREAWALRGLLTLGKLGQRLASVAYQRLAPRASQGG